MAEFAALPLFTDAWIADTAHLTYAERGLYIDLLVLMWRSPDCRVPNDVEWILRKLNLKGDATALLLVQCHIKEFCQSDGNWISQKRLLKEYEYVKKHAKKMSDMAKARWNKGKATSYSNAAYAMQAQDAHSNAPTPTYKDARARENNFSGKKKKGATVPVFENTPQWEAWKATGKPLLARDLKDDDGRLLGRGWYFPSEYPEPKEQAA